MAGIAAQLADPHCRLLTILAVGGMGKTRLGIEAARAQLPGFTDGVTYVELAPVSAARSDTSINPLAAALADALNFPLHGGDSPERQLLRYLHRREMLLVLDNFEHLLDTAVLVGDLLQNAPDIKILTTSRERLNLKEEWLFTLHGLSSQDAINSEAVQLFSQKAKQVQPTFDLEPELNAVLRICRLVEGMPLALELAAAWILQLSCAEIAEEIEAEIDFLTTRARNIPERHRSMRALFGYSWQRLSPKEKKVLQKVSVFRGGFDRRAAKAVAGASLVTLSDLVSKSLLSVTQNGRYAIHELLRQFAAEKLAQGGSRLQEVEKQHAQYFMTLVREQAPNAWKGGDSLRSLNTLTQDFDNIRLAALWAVHHQPQLFDHQIGTVFLWLFEIKGWYIDAVTLFSMIVDRLQLDCNMLRRDEGFNPGVCFLLADYQTSLGFSQTRLGFLAEGEKNARDALQLVSQTEQPAALKVKRYCLRVLGGIAFFKGEFAQALKIYQEAADLAEPVVDKTTYNNILLTIANILQYTGEFDHAAQLLRATISHFDQIGDDNPEIWNEMGKLSAVQGSFDEADRYFERGINLATQQGNRTYNSFAWRERADIPRLQFDFEKARTFADQAMKIAEEINLPWATTLAYWFMGNLTLDEGDYGAAVHYFDSYKQRSPAQQELPGGPGWAYLGLGKIEEAHQSFVSSLRLMLDVEARPIGLDALVGMAHVRAHYGLIDEALGLLTLVAHHRSSSWEVKRKARKLWEELAAESPSEILTQAGARGREMDLWQTAESLVTEAEEANIYSG